MPGFSGTDALALVRGKSLDLPFIFLSGTTAGTTLMFSAAAMFSFRSPTRGVAWTPPP